jgi:hypothetical protein
MSLINALKASEHCIKCGHYGNGNDEASKEDAAVQLSILLMRDLRIRNADGQTFDYLYETDIIVITPKQLETFINQQNESNKNGNRQNKNIRNKGLLLRAAELWQTIIHAFRFRY